MTPHQRADAKKKGLLKNKKVNSVETDIVESEVDQTQPKQCQSLGCGSSKSYTLSAQNKRITERVGDWTCQRCFNHNFAFRDACNMCYMSHIESNKLLYGQQA